MALCVYQNTDNDLNPFYSFHVSVIESTEGYTFKSMTKRAPCLHTVHEVNAKKRLIVWKDNRYNDKWYNKKSGWYFYWSICVQNKLLHLWNTKWFFWERQALALFCHLKSLKVTFIGLPRSLKQNVVKQDMNLFSQDFKKYPIWPNVILFIRFQKKSEWAGAHNITSFPSSPYVSCSSWTVSNMYGHIFALPRANSLLFFLKITVGHSIGCIVEWQTRKLRTWMTCSRMQQNPN